MTTSEIEDRLAADEQMPARHWPEASEREERQSDDRERDNRH